MSGLPLKKRLKSNALLQREDQSIIPASWLVCPLQNTFKTLENRQYAACDLILPILGLCVLLFFTYHISMIPAQRFIYEATQPPFFKVCILIGANTRRAEHSILGMPTSAKPNKK